MQATNPGFTYAPEQDDKDANGELQSPQAINGADALQVIQPQPQHVLAMQENNALPPNNIQAAVVADVEITKQAQVAQVQVAEAHGNGVKVTAAHGINLKVEEKIRQRHELVQTDEGLHYRRVTSIERPLYAEIIGEICIEAKLENRQQLAIEEVGDPAMDATCYEKCIDVCCQSCVCNFRNPFSRQKDKPMVKKRDILTPILRRGRAKGWNIFSRFAFPLVRDTVRDFWVIAELLTVLAAFSVCDIFCQWKKRNLQQLAPCTDNSFNNIGPD